MNILFVFAHPDDEAFGPAGTIANLAKHHTVMIKLLCNGARPGHEHVVGARQAAFAEACKLLCVDYQLGVVPDLGLTCKIATKEIEDVVGHFNPRAVYTNNISDINADHRVTAESCMVACRPTPLASVKELYMCEVPSSTSWAFNQFTPTFEPNTYVNVAGYMDLKNKLVDLYNTETRDFPDARSFHAVASLAEYRGCQVGVTQAEAFKQIYRIE